MKRIDYFLSGAEKPIEYPEDIKKLKEYFPELKALSDSKVQEIYREYSEDYYCAGWLILTEDSRKEFSEYLQGEMWWEGSFFDQGESDE